eukprot:TRINITY_DN6720_c0_g1_i1.p1 TRINITY_DN6720_c0_g1~~TRINITY_DN6720_c0_g1_i1.p1  ORF type:complete len:330 (+),score=55.62 TRINITY_DN6720_c0_g1_i1:43-1032(+)
MGAKHRKNRSPQGSAEKRKLPTESSETSGIGSLGNIVGLIIGGLFLLAAGLFVYGDQLAKKTGSKAATKPQGEAVYNSDTGKSQMRDDVALEATEIAKYHHDPKAFTQGLLLLDGYLYESTGMYGESEFRKVEIETGKVVKSYKLDDKLFGEGLTYVPETERFYQLTWKEGVMLEFDKEMNLVKSHTNLPSTKTRELWGICNNGTHFFVSDGSHNIYVWTISDLQPVTRIAVFDTKGRKVTKLNELECVSKQGTYPDIFVNIWYSDIIHRVDLVTATVIKSYDMSALHTRRNQHDVLNGIALSDDLSQMYITGKWWPTMHLFSMKEVSK